MTARGIRNNNPGNIRLGDDWQGMAEKQTDPEFCQFTEMRWGLRAMTRILCRYYYVKKLATIEDIIGRWAPPSENRTEDYANYVSGYCLVHRWDALSRPPANHHQWAMLVCAMCRQESGMDWADWLGYHGYDKFFGYVVNAIEEYRAGME